MDSLESPKAIAHGNTVSIVARQFRQGILRHCAGARLLGTGFELEPAADVVGLLFSLRNLGPALGTLALQPQAVQFLDGGLTVAAHLGEITSDDKTRSANAGAAVQVNAALPVERRADLLENVQGLSGTLGQAGVRDGGTQVLGVYGQQVPIGGQFAGFGEVDEVVEAGLTK
jgi:hypothetical protein